MKTLLMTLIVAASLFSFSTSTTTPTTTTTTTTITSTICSAISNPDCRCTTPPSSSSSSSLPYVRCTFTSSTPSPLFPNSSFSSSVQLGTLDLSRNNLNSLPEDFLQQEAVDVLVLRENKLEEVPGVLRKLRRLRSLDVSLNALRSLSLEVLGGVAGLQIVDMSGNKLTSLSDDVEEGQLSKLKNVKELSLARNRIESMDNNTLSLLSGLTSLDLSYNRLSQVTQITFRPLRMTLQTLDLSGNALTHLHPLAFRLLHRLHVLSLADSGVRGVMGELWFPQHLSRLDLRQCGLTSIHRCRLADLRDLVVLDLRGNPLQCTCELFFLQQSFQNTASNQSQWSCQNQPTTAANSSDLTSPSTGTGSGGQIVVADLDRQCQDSYTACPSVSGLVEKMVTKIDVGESGNTLVISWTLEGDDNLRIDGFQLRYIPEEADPITSDIVPSDQRRLEMDTPGLAEHYVVCLDILMYTSALVHQECRSLQDGSGNSMVVGILAGVVFLAPCLVILAYVFFKDHRMSKTPYYLVGDSDDVEKQRPQHVLSVNGGDKKKLASIMKHDAENTARVVVTESVVRETGGGATAQDSETGSNTSDEKSSTHHVRFTGSGEQQANSEDTAQDKAGIRNLGFHGDGTECTDPNHESTNM